MMQMRLWSVLAITLLACAACGKEKGEKKADPKEKAEKSAKKDPGNGEKGAAKQPAVKPGATKDAVPPAEKPAEKPSPAAEQCTRILTKSWDAAKANLTRLQVADVDSLKDAYLKSGKTYLERCTKLPQAARDCMEKADNAVEAIDTCKVNKDRKSNEKLFAVDMQRHVKLFEPKPLDEAEGKKRLAALKGKWVNDWKSAKIHNTWQVAANGDVTVKQIKFDKPQPDETLYLSFAQERRLVVQRGNSKQPYTFFMPSKRLFYASSNQLYDVYPIADQKSFLIRNDWDYIEFKNGKCEVFNARGNVTTGKCRFAKAKGKKVFQASYTYPGKVWNTGKPAVEERTYYIIKGHFLHQSLVEAGTYKKK